jgi:TPR repeat protein
MIFKGGNIKAMFELSKCYWYGYGIIKDEKKGLELLLKSVQGGYKVALYVLRYCYQYGDYTFIKDEDKAFEFYLKAAEKNHSYSQYKVANYYNDVLKKVFIGLEKLQ